MGAKRLVPGQSQRDGKRVGDPDWSSLVLRIRQHDPSGVDDLYSIFVNPVRSYLRRHLGRIDHLEDVVHDVFLTVVQGIVRGDLSEPNGLNGYIRTVLHRKVAGRPTT
jgi:DNA-directed RNA polymerase specialized sigma24 family protein